MLLDLGENESPNIAFMEVGMSQKIIRLPAVLAFSGLSRSLTYLYISKGLWPKPVSLGARAVGWPEHEIIAMNTARIAGQSNHEIQELVNKLEASRKG